MRYLIAATRELLTGPNAYRARSPWHPLLAIAAGCAILGAGALVATALVSELRLSPAFPLPQHESMLAHNESRIWVMGIWLVGMQASIVVLVTFAAGLFGGRPADVLALNRQTPVRLFIAAIIAMFVLQVLYNVFVLPFAHESAVEDARPFLQPLHSNAFWLFALAIVVGAPLSEELLFRGFLLSALSQSRLGYIGATLITTLAWTVLHAGYSGLGLVEVFLAGLFFSWLLWRTGNLLVPLVCHAFYNGVVLVALLFVPGG